MSAHLDNTRPVLFTCRPGFLRFKRVFDLLVSLILVPAFLLTGLVLLIVNPFLNPGPLFFAQDRMGRGCRPFRAWKFRSMLGAAEIARGPYDPAEDQRITTLGQFLRRTRLDELPQIINVLKGEMSLIGPRPDYLAHARRYLEEIPGYRERHVVRPGISGYAQITVGYAETPESVREKVAADLWYIRNASIRLDCWIAWRTFVTVLHGLGR
ncbi:MAG: sugar transferase [Rubellimicrobium sp.]|nr:sugar transferase [Rubellimicrobium sp.]